MRAGQRPVVGQISENLHRHLFRIKLGTDESELVSAELTWETVVESSGRAVWRGVGRALQRYRDERCGATLLALQTSLSTAALLTLVPGNRHILSNPPPFI